MLEQISVSVVIPAYNAAGTIERCMQGLKEQSMMPLEIIVVDNGSSDATKDYITSIICDFPCEIRLLNETSRGAATARNCGVRDANGAWIAFTDADCEPEADWIETGCRLIAAKKLQTMVGPAWGTLEGGLSAKLLGLTTLSVGLPEHWVTDVGGTGTRGFATANFWIRKKLFDAVGGFDETLTISGEDYDLCGRIYRYGERILYAPSLCVRHHHTDGVVGMLAKAVRYGQAHGMLFDRYGESGMYLDWVGGRQFRFASRRKIWVNLVSAEKKAGVLLLLGMVHPFFLILFLLYPMMPAAFLRRRLLGRDKKVGLIETYAMAWLLIVRSAAFTFGRIRGSRPRVWLA